MNIRDFMNIVETSGDYRLNENGNDPLGVVAKIKELDNAFNAEYDSKFPPKYERHGSPFHLAPCGRCHSPVWQQPCPVCGFYPQGGSDDGVRMDSPEWTERAKAQRAKAHDLYVKLINQYGNIAAWYFASKRKTSLYSIGTGKTRESGFVRWDNSVPIPEHARAYAELVEAYIKKAAAMSFPDAETIWNAYNRGE